MSDRHEVLLDTLAASPLHKGQRFIRDGIIDPARWKQAPRRVLFLLKEAYDTEGSGFDLRQLILHDWGGPRHKMWWSAGQWASALHGLTDRGAPCFPDDDAASESLLASAVVNLKKSGGRSSSDLAEVQDYASRDADALRQQVALIGPDVIECGYTWDVAYPTLWPDAIHLHEMVWRVGNAVAFDFWHPANQYPNQINYWALVGLAMSSGVLPQRRVS